MTGGVFLNTAPLDDPRFSKAQQDAFLKIATADPEAVILGLDHAHRPVVRASLGVPRSAAVWAIQRNGDPTAPKYTEGTQAGLLETWGSR
jgi:hypothetical protein